MVIFCSRKNDSDSKGPSPKRMCYLKEFGPLRREDFKDDNAWDRFVGAIDNIRKENRMLHRRNDCLRKFKEI